MKINSIRNATHEDVEFVDVKAWFDEHMAPDVIDFDDQSVYEYVYHGGRWAGIFQCTSQGAQRLFVKAQPRSIVDIATLTSIYRPGPLAADVDKLYIKAKHGSNYEWPDPRIGEILKATYGCIIFQEQVMELAEKVAGFPKDECDQVRRAIMKRSISGGAAQKKQAQETRTSFVEGCIRNDYTKAVANDLYDKILYFAGYGFNKAHATAYAMDSYFCAWLMTHHEPQWLCAYAESMSTNDKKRGKAFSELRALGYQIVPIDIRHATAYWRILPGKKMMPSLVSCKGVGETAAKELVRLRMVPDDDAAGTFEDSDTLETLPDEQPMRPFEDLEELLWDADGKWRPSKFNKKAIEALVNVGAFASLGIIGEGKTFKNYHHMSRVVVDHMSEIKRTLKSDPLVGKKRYYELIRELSNTRAWSRQERMKLTVQHFGSVDVNSLVPVPIAERLATKGIESIDDFDESNIYWFCIADQKARTSKNGKKYLILTALGPAGSRNKMFMWSWDGKLKFEPYTVVLGEVSRNEFGFTTSQRKLRVLDV